MATPYIAIGSTETDPDKPLTSFLAKRWSDNHKGAMSGAVAATDPLLNACFGTQGPGSQFIGKLSPSGYALPVVVATSGGAGAFSATTPYASALGFTTIINTGTIRFTGTVDFSGSSGVTGMSGYLSLYKNGTLITNLVGAFNASVAFTAGDTLYFGASVSAGAPVGGSTVTARINYFLVFGTIYTPWRS